MKRAAILAILAGCGFRIGTGSSADDASPSDGLVADGETADTPPPTDGMIPDQPIVTVPACTLRSQGSPSTATLLGGSSGNQTGTPTCSSDKVAVGLQFEVSPIPIAPHNNQILMTTVRLWCATVSRTTMNQWETSGVESFSHTGLMGSTATACDAYKPPAVLSSVMCPTGSVLVGIAGHQVDTTLYNDVSIRCAALGPDGAITASTVTIGVVGTGTNAVMPEETSCNTGRAITALRATSGCGQDGVTAMCSPFTCEQ